MSTEADSLFVKPGRAHPNEGGRDMRPGTYRDVNGVLVTVARTATGYSVTYPDGTVTLIGAAS